jgi:ATP-dependent Clp protease ATP-binding subunit ClpX
MEQILLSTMFDLPSLDNVTEVVVDADVVHGRKEPVRVMEGKQAKRKDEAA